MPGRPHGPANEVEMSGCERRVGDLKPRGRHPLVIVQQSDEIGIRRTKPEVQRARFATPRLRQQQNRKRSSGDQRGEMREIGFRVVVDDDDADLQPGRPFGGKKASQQVGQELRTPESRDEQIEPHVRAEAISVP